MAECKRCLYFDVCKMYADDVRGDYEDNCLFEDCSNFKNKTGFVEVVRCKDCILYKPNYLPGLKKNDDCGICTRYEFLSEKYTFRVETDFCSYGTPKERSADE